MKIPIVRWADPEFGKVNTLPLDDWHDYATGESDFASSLPEAGDAPSMSKLANGYQRNHDRCILESEINFVAFISDMHDVDLASVRQTASIGCRIT